MPDDRFEARLAAGLELYAAGRVRPVDPLAVARAAVERRSVPSPLTRPFGRRSDRLVLIWLAALLAVLAVGLAIVGSGALNPPRPLRVVTTPITRAATDAPVKLTGPGATTSVLGQPEIVVAGGADGVTPSFTTGGGGRYDIVVDVGAGPACAFALILTTARDGPRVQSDTAFLVASAGDVVSEIWTIAPGSYVLQEDETGTTNCRRAFKAFITAS